MKIEVEIVKENKDGSADAQVSFDKQGLEVLVQWGLVAMLTKAIDEYKVRPEKAVKRQQKTPVIAKKKIVAKKSK
jgi:hypothetical protein